MKQIIVTGRGGYGRGRGDEPTPQEVFMMSDDVMRALYKLPVNQTGKKIVTEFKEITTGKILREGSHALFISCKEAGYAGKTPAGHARIINKFFVALGIPFYGVGGYEIEENENGNKIKVMGVKIVRTSEEFDPTLYATMENVEKGISEGETAHEEPSPKMRDRVTKWAVENGYAEIVKEVNEVDELEADDSEIGEEVEEVKKE